MTALPPLLLALFVGCTVDQQPDSGVFVGNPGKLELTAARSADYQLSGFILLEELVLGACGSQQSITTQLEDRQLTLVDDGTLRFELDEPLQIPPGAWCRMELLLSTASLTAEGLGADGGDSTFLLDFDRVAISVSGTEFVIDDQLLALELAEPDWLLPLSEVVAEDPNVVDLAAVAPEVHGILRAALEERSALYLLDLGSGGDLDQNPPEAAEGDAPLWSGDDREPEPTEPTDTGPSDPPAVNLQIDIELPLQTDITDVGPPVFVDDLVYVPVASVDLGSAVFTVQDYGYDPAAASIQAEASEVALTSDGQQLYLLSATPAGAAVDTLSIDSLDPVTTTPFPGSPRRPEAGLLASGPVATWLDADQLQFTYANDDQAVPLAEGVLDYDLATDGSEGMLIGWIEAVSNPLAPSGSTAQFSAYLAEDRTVLFEGASSGALARPKVALAGTTAVVARLDGGQLAADVYGVDGVGQVPLSLGTDSVEAYDIAMVADVVLVAWSGPDGLQLQLFDAGTGLSITEPVRSGNGEATEVVAAVQGDGLLRFAVASLAQGQGWVLHGWSEGALTR